MNAGIWQRQLNAAVALRCTSGGVRLSNQSRLMKNIYFHYYRSLSNDLAVPQSRSYSSDVDVKGLFRESVDRVNNPMRQTEKLIEEFRQRRKGTDCSASDAIFEKEFATEVVNPFGEKLSLGSQTKSSKKQEDNNDVEGEVEEDWEDKIKYPHKNKKKLSRAQYRKMNEKEMEDEYGNMASNATEEEDFADILYRNNFEEYEKSIHKPQPVYLNRFSKHRNSIIRTLPEDVRFGLSEKAKRIIASVEEERAKANNESYLDQHIKKPFSLSNKGNKNDISFESILPTDKTDLRNRRRQMNVQRALNKILVKNDTMLSMVFTNAGVRVTRVMFTKGGGAAHILWRSMKGKVFEEPEEVRKTNIHLDFIKKRLRHIVQAQVKMRRIPEFKFDIDKAERYKDDLDVIFETIDNDLEEQEEYKKKYALDE